MRVGIVIAVVALGLAGCSLLPEWRVFQKKVPAGPAMVEKTEAQREGERRAAAYIDERSKPPVKNPADAVSDIHAVSGPLRASLGEPKQPVQVDDRAKDDVIASLRTGLAAKEKQLEAWKAFGRKYGGKELEGTGVDLAGPAGLLGLAGVVALCIACPAVGYVVLRVLPLLWGFFSRTTEAVAEYAKSNPREGEKLGAMLSAKMDSAHKRLVKRRAKTTITDATRAPFPTPSGFVP